jgi:hypothetical protein
VKRALVLAALALCPGAQSAAPKVPAFDHVIVIVFENKARAEVLGSPAAPAFNALAKRGAVLSDYRGLVHPSLPNYLALVSGSMHGIAWNCTSCTVAGRSLADTLEAKGLTWKAYAEGLPRPGWTGAVSGRYAKKHEPFLYFRRVLTSRARLRRVVPLAQLSRDLAAKRLPDFALVTPDMCHDMHDCPVSTGDAWLGRFLPPLVRLPGTVVVVTFDEASGPDPGVPALVLGPLVRPGSAFVPKITHYGLLRTVEDGLRVARLGASAGNGPVTGIWR